MTDLCRDALEALRDWRRAEALSPGDRGELEGKWRGKYPLLWQASIAYERTQSVPPRIRCVAEELAQKALAEDKERAS